MKKKVTIGIIAAAVVVVLLLVFLGPGLSRKNNTEKDIIIADQTSEEAQESVSEAAKTESEQTDTQKTEETDIIKEETEPENISAADSGSSPVEDIPSEKSLPSENNTEEVALDPEEAGVGGQSEGENLPVLPAVVDGADDGESYETEEVPIN